MVEEMEELRKGKRKGFSEAMGREPEAWEFFPFSKVIDFPSTSQEGISSPL